MGLARDARSAGYAGIKTTDELAPFPAPRAVGDTLVVSVNRPDSVIAPAVAVRAELR
jgi:hypothetical protein